MTNVIENIFSNHALKRTQQRGIRPWIVDFILDYADKFKHANQSCISQFVSQRKLKKLVEEKVITPARAALIEGVVVTERDNTVITVFHKRMRMRS